MINIFQETQHYRYIYSVIFLNLHFFFFFYHAYISAVAVTSLGLICSIKQWKAVRQSILWRLGVMARYPERKNTTYFTRMMGSVPGFFCMRKSPQQLLKGGHCFCWPAAVCYTSYWKFVKKKKRNLFDLDSSEAQVSSEILIEKCRTHLLL